jgi:hypothetical protein
MRFEDKAAIVAGGASGIGKRGRDAVRRRGRSGCHQPADPVFSHET